MFVEKGDASELERETATHSFLDTVFAPPILGGEWLEQLLIPVQPLDAGTDNGLTFTSPNWATQPREAVSVITNTVPSHPAASFYYPHLPALPNIATYSVTKLREYSRLKTKSRNTNKMTTDAERYRYNLNTSHPDKEEIHFVPLNVTHLGKENKVSKIKSDKEIFG